MASIDAARLMANLRKLSEFGKYKTGVHRPTFSAQDMQARAWFRDRLDQFGYMTSIDGVGNVFGISPAQGPRLLIGSHIESKDRAGWLDGALGVIYALEIAQSLRSDPNTAALAVDVVAWSDEESHFINFLGSRSYTGDLGDEEMDKAISRDGVPLRTALQNAGLAELPRLQFTPATYVGYLEAHIEQGDYLEQGNKSIGIVSDMVGNWRYRIIFSGVQNHAGTTRMAIRKDPGVAMARFCVEVAERFPDVAGPRSVWTTGRILLHPGDPGVIPGEAEMHFQFRDADFDQLKTLEALLLTLVEEANLSGPCSVKLHVVAKSLPQQMSPQFRAALEVAATKHADNRFLHMPSAAGHDAQILAKVMPAGMLFVPSIGGISHHWDENTKEEDIILGCRVMADAVESILRQA